MHLSDITDPDGPYWAAYQEARARDRILDNPSEVPAWFVAKLARDRVAAARVAMDKLTSSARAGSYDERAEVWRALRVVEGYIREGHTLDDGVAQVVAGLLGAQEVETRRERVEDGQLPGDDRPAFVREYQHRDRVALSKTHLIEGGITEHHQLAALHADEDRRRRAERVAEWVALAEIQAARP